MQLQIEKTENHSIKRYDAQGVVVGATTYRQPVLISTNHCIAMDDKVNEFADLPDDARAALEKVEILLIGSESSREGLIKRWRLPLEMRQKIGVEFMGLGPACRTFNVLLSEARLVAVLLLFRQ